MTFAIFEYVCHQLVSHKQSKNIFSIKKKLFELFAKLKLGLGWEL